LEAKKDFGKTLKSVKKKVLNTMKKKCRTGEGVKFCPSLVEIVNRQMQPRQGN